MPSRLLISARLNIRLISIPAASLKELDLEFTNAFVGRAGVVENDDVNGTTNLLERWHALSESERAAMSQRVLHCSRTHFEGGRNTRQIFDVVRGYRRTTALTSTNGR